MKTVISQIPFYLIRHGQTDWNLENRIMGILDIPLNAHGKLQSKNALHQIQNLHIKTICPSPLMRARQTAEILNQALHCDMMPIEELREFNLGSYGGKLVGNWFEKWMSGDLISGGESFKEFVQRTLVGVEKALLQKGPVLIVAHGGTYWAIKHAVQLLDLPDLPNCMLARFCPPNSLNNQWSCFLS